MSEEEEDHHVLLAADLEGEEHSYSDPFTREEIIEIIDPREMLLRQEVVVDLSASGDDDEHNEEIEEANMQEVVEDMDSFEENSEDIKKEEQVEENSKENTSHKTTKRKRPVCIDVDNPPKIIIKPQATECSICYDLCKIIGKHRLVSLKCGHVFGKSCIERWIKERKTCPNCNITVRKADIRALYSDHVAVVDNSGVEEMREKFEHEKKKRIQAETDLSRSKLLATVWQTECQKHQEKIVFLEKEIIQLRGALAEAKFKHNYPPCTPTPTPPVSVCASGATAIRSSQAPSMHFSQSQSYCIDYHQGWKYREVFRLPLQESRVFDISTSCTVACIGESCTKKTGAFTGSPWTFGFTKVSTFDPRHLVMIPIHKAPVRDLQINQAQELVVTTSFDAQLAVTNLNSHSVVWKTTIPRQGWSCTFSQIDPFAIFCGFNDGTIAKYDLRRSASCHSNGMVEPVITYHMSMRQPVHSVRIGISNNSISSEGKEMLFGATFSRFASWKCLNQDQEGGTPIVLPLEIPVTNCSALTNCQGNSHQVLVSSRTQGTSLPAKLQLFDMSKEGSSGGADGADGANGADGADRAPWCVLTGHRTPSVLSRTTMWYSAEGIPLIAAGDEESKQILVWNAKTKQIVSRICHGMERPIIDLAHIVQNGSWQNQKALFGALSAQQFVLYQS